MTDANGIPVSPRFLTCVQAARYLSLSKWSLYRLVAQRKVPFIPLSPSHPERGDINRPTIRFDVKALDRWMESKTVKSVE